MKRREFLGTSAGIAAGTMFAPYIAKAKKNPIFKANDKIESLEGDNIIIIIELFGGNDGLNTILPYEQEEEYLKLRPTLHIPKDQASQFGTSELFMNKALVEDVHIGGMMRLMEDGRLAIIQGVGYSNPNLSHFRSKEIWHSGINSSDPKEKLLEGWLGRFFANKLTEFPEIIPQHPLAISLGGTIPLLLKSNKGHMGITLKDPEQFFELGEGLAPDLPKFGAPYDNFYQKEFDFVHIIAEQSQKYAQEVKSAYENGINKIKVDYSEGLPQKMKTISALIAGGLQTKVYYINLSNFDSHAQQMQADYTGQHANLLNELSRAISEFLDDALQQGFHQRVTGMTFSEFGRRTYDNGSRGTDHGAASMQFVFAGSDDFINSAYYKEDEFDLTDLDTLDNLKHQYDFRRIYNDFLETWLGAEQSDTQQVFNEEFLPLGVLKPRVTGVNDPIESQEGDKISISPNPTNGFGNISFTLKKNSNITLSIYTLEGIKVMDLHKGYLAYGKYDIQFRLIKQGAYIVLLKAGNFTYTKKMIVIK